MPIITNYNYTTTFYEYESNKKIAPLRILQISDLHGDFPHHNTPGAKKLMELIGRKDSINPDLVFITGDIIDRKHFAGFNEVLNFLDFIKQYKCFYVTGNHEYMHPECASILPEIDKRGICILDNSREQLTYSGEQICITGFSDPLKLYGKNMPPKYRTPVTQYKELIARTKVNPAEFNILLAHRPEFFEDYAAAGYDMVFTGHAHGGQWRLPILGSVFAPDQGFHPKYSAGKYESVSNTTESNDNQAQKIPRCTMYVSRGLGNSTMPVRIFNPPELVVVNIT